jgi:hypothetical protein
MTAATTANARPIKVNNPFGVPPQQEMTSVSLDGDSKGAVPGSKEKDPNDPFADDPPLLEGK